MCQYCRANNCSGRYIQLLHLETTNKLFTLHKLLASYTSVCNAFLLIKHVFTKLKHVIIEGDLNTLKDVKLARPLPPPPNKLLYF